MIGPKSNNRGIISTTNQQKGLNNDATNKGGYLDAGGNGAGDVIGKVLGISDLHGQARQESDARAHAPPHLHTDVWVLKTNRLLR